MTREGKLTTEAILLLDQVEHMFESTSNKYTNKKLGLNFEENVRKYREMIPKGKFGSRYLRTAEKQLMKKFKTFFREYKYDWNTIFQATKLYLDEQRKSQYLYCAQSDYFIKKSDQSKLADYCQILSEGGGESSNKNMIRLV
jgi:hypothetical protein